MNIAEDHHCARIVLYTLMQEVCANPNHLEPIRPYDSSGIN